MEYSIKYNNIELVVNSKGAEWEHVYYNGIDYARDRDEFWNRKAPVLFPIVGKFRGLKTFIDGKEYHMGQHGIARDMEFSLFEQKENKLVFKTTYNEETLKVYPYMFELYITYKIEDKTIKVIYDVKNVQDQPMYFNIGGHPAIRLPLYKNEKFEDYTVYFEKIENFDAPTVSDEGTLNFIETIPYRNIDKIDLEYKYFEIDAIVIPNIKSSFVKLVNKNGKGVKFSYKGFNTLAIWTKPNAPFLCLEPWKGYADHSDSDYDFMKKDDLVKIDKGEISSFEYDVTILD